MNQGKQKNYNSRMQIKNKLPQHKEKENWDQPKELWHMHTVKSDQVKSDAYNIRSKQILLIGLQP